MMTEHIEHCFAPVFDGQSKILILGTMPSPASRQMGFYYSHPRNRFWPVMAQLLDEPLPLTPDEKRELCLRRHIALWDVLASCDIDGASDSSIRKPIANDIASLVSDSSIKAIFTTGAKAAQLYQRYCSGSVQLPHFALPSSSPANAKMKTEQLAELYSVMLPWLQ